MKGFGEICSFNKPSQCHSMGIWRPSILVHVAGSDKFRLDFNVPICDEHKKGTNIANFITESVLKQIQQMFKNICVHSPQLADMTLEWEPNGPNTLVVTDGNGNYVGQVGVIK